MPIKSKLWQRLLNRLLGPAPDELVGRWTKYDDTGFLAVYGWALTFHPDGTGEYEIWGSFAEEDEYDPDFHFTWRRTGPRQVELRTDDSASIVTYRLDEATDGTEELVNTEPSGAHAAGESKGFWFLHEPVYRPWHPRAALRKLLGG